MVISNSKPSNLGCFVYPLSGLGGFITFLMLFAAIGFSATYSFIFSVMGSAVGIFIAWLFMRSGKVDFS
ncbi:hypothetical protein CL649_02635 [bacterium]|nr:hypothetical protein [bacterium]